MANVESEMTLLLSLFGLCRLCFYKMEILSLIPSIKYYILSWSRAHQEIFNGLNCEVLCDSLICAYSYLDLVICFE